VPQTQSRLFFLKMRKISFTCRNSKRRPSIPWLRHSTEHAIPALSVTIGVSSRSYLVPTTHTLAQHAHNHTSQPVIRGFLNAELSTGLHNGLPCRSPCGQCRPLYSEEHCRRTVQYTNAATSCTACICGQVLSQGFRIPSTSSVSNRTQQSQSWISFRCQAKR